MSRRFWWLMVAAASLALGGTRVGAAEKAAATAPAKAKCGKDCCKNGQCGKTCCTDCPNDCCPGCGTCCCKDGCPGKTKAVSDNGATAKTDNKPLIFFVVLPTAGPMPAMPAGVYMPAPMPNLPMPGMPVAMPMPMPAPMPVPPPPPAPGIAMPEPIPMCPGSVGNFASAAQPMAAAAMPCPMPVARVPADAKVVKCYTVELKSMEARSEKDPVVCQCPRMFIPAGGDAQCCFDNETVLGKCTGHCVGGCCAKGNCPMGLARGTIHVHVGAEHDGVLDVDVDVQQADIEHGKDGVQVLTKTLHAVRHVGMEKPTRLVLDRCTDGSPCRWIEVTVSAPHAAQGPVGRAPCCGAAEALAMPHPAGPECEESETATSVNFWSALGQLMEEIADSVCPGSNWADLAMSYGCVTEPAEDMPEMMCLPATFVQEPMPPQAAMLPPPAPMLPPLPAREMALPAPPVMPVVHAGPAPVPMSCCGAVCQPVQTCGGTAPAPAVLCLRVTASKESGLDVCQGDVCLSSKKLVLKSDRMEPLTLTATGGQVRLRYADLRARADSLSTDRKDILVLEGHVRVCYGSGEEKSDVVASRVEINWADGSMKIKP